MSSISTFMSKNSMAIHITVETIMFSIFGYYFYNKIGKTTSRIDLLENKIKYLEDIIIKQDMIMKELQYTVNKLFNQTFTFPNTAPQSTPIFQKPSSAPKLQPVNIFSSFSLDSILPKSSVQISDLSDTESQPSTDSTLKIHQPVSVIQENKEDLDKEIENELKELNEN